MIVGVTGSSGKLGRATMAHLRDHGHQVIGFDRQGAVGFDFTQIDLGDYGQTLDAFLGVTARHDGLDALVHLAAIPVNGIVPDAATFDANVSATFHTLFAAHRAGIRTVVVASSITAMGFPFDEPPPSLPVDETFTRAHNTYGLGKVAEEAIAAQLTGWADGTSITALRFTNVVAADEYATFDRADDPTYRRDLIGSWVDARDGALAVRLALESAAPGFEVYNVAAPESGTRAPSREVAGRWFPDTPVADDLGEYESLMSTRKIQRERVRRPARLALSTLDRMETAGVNRVGIREVATHADVGIGTVSNYLNHPERVSEATAGRIAAAIDTLGFVPSQAGRQLRSGTSRVIGYLAPDISNPYFTEIAESVEQGASARNVSVFFADSHRSHSREDAYLSVFEEHRVLGLLVSSHEPIEDRLAQVRRRGTPSVLVGQQAHHPQQPSVSVDDVSGGRQAAAHLLDLGRRRVAFVGGPLTIAQVASRLTGASAAVSGTSAGLEIIDTTDRTVRGGQQIGQALLDRPPERRPDGILAVNDLVALGIMQSLVHGGVQVPEDVAIVGYDDNEFAEASLIPLSSVRGRHEDFGSTMITLLFEAIAGEFSGEVHRTFEPTLVVRASTTGR